MTLPASDHFNGKTFFQPGKHPERGWRDVLKWRLTSRAAQWPRHVDLAPQPPPPAPKSGQFVVTWLGHATFLVQTTAGNLLLDPVFSERVSPLHWAGPRRVHHVPVPLESLPRIDAVFVSHDHYDHFDNATLQYLARKHRDLVFVAPLRHRDLLAELGARAIVELDWWDSHSFNPDLRLSLTPTKHWSNRIGTPRNYRLWGGAWIQLGNTDGHTTGVASSCTAGTRRLWFVGDTGYDDRLFAEVRTRCGTPDIALVPIGAYEPRWFMAPMHMNPDEAVRSHCEVGARVSIGMHWGTFQLTDEAREAPLRALETARDVHGVAPDAFRVLQPGESYLG